MSQTTAVILAGGVGKRFAPFTTSKLEFPFMGRSVYEHVLDFVASLGIKRAVMVVSPTLEKVIRAKHFSLPISFVTQPEPNGMAGALLKAESLIGSSFLVLNATDLFEPNLVQTLEPLLSKQSSFIVAKKVSSYFPGGYIKLKPDNNLSEIIEKPGEGNEPSDLVNLVVHYISQPKDFLSLLKDTQSSQDDVYERALTKYASTHPVRVVSYTGDWAALKYPHHVLSVSQSILKHTLPEHPRHEGYIHATVIIQGEVYIAESAQVLPYAIIKGPAYIGPNTVIGDHATVRESIVEEGSVIGSYSEVVRSYIGPGCQLHQNYLGDSVLEKDVWLGAKTLTANFRLDHGPIVLKTNPPVPTNLTKLGAFIASGVRTGVNVSFMPGVCVGQGAVIGPTTLVTDSVEPYTTVYAKQTYSISNQVKVI